MKVCIFTSSTIIVWWGLVWAKNVHCVMGALDPKSVLLKDASSACQVKERVEMKSQRREDEIVFDHYFSNPPKCGGTVLEIGGFDGLHYSNSYFFEYALGWQTILIEAFPRNYQKMIINRPNAINKFGAICFGEDMEFAIGKNPATGGLVTNMNAHHREKWTNNETGVIRVPCATIAGVLHDHNIKHIDVFFLDVEGAELTVLQTVDWSAVTISMFVVEMDQQNPSKDEAVRDVLSGKGYVQPFNMREECKKRGGKCANNEIFVLPELLSDSA